jgi:uncharacterized protein YjbI with pentapeptide repeats
MHSIVWAFYFSEVWKEPPLHCLKTNLIYFNTCHHEMPQTRQSISKFVRSHFIFETMSNVAANWLNNIGATLCHRRSCCRLSYCRLSYGRLSYCQLSYCRLTYWRLSYCQLSHCHLSYCQTAHCGYDTVLKLDFAYHFVTKPSQTYHY